MKPKKLFHCLLLAAITDTGNMLWFDRASKKPDLLLRITVLGVIELLRFCRQMRIGVCLRCC